MFENSFVTTKTTDEIISENWIGKRQQQRYGKEDHRKQIHWKIKDIKPRNRKKKGFGFNPLFAFASAINSNKLKYYYSVWK